MLNHYPPLVYGRCMTDVDPEASSGAAVCQLTYKGAPTFVAITYKWVPRVRRQGSLCRLLRRHLILIAQMLSVL